MSTHDDDVPGLPPGVQLDLFVPGGAGPESTRYMATWILDRGSHCGQCGSREIFVQRQPYIQQGKPLAHVGAYCAGCGRHVKWIGASEKARVLERGGDV